MANVITSVDQLNFSIGEIPAMPLPKKVLMVRPTYFSVDYVINPHMAENVGTVDKVKAGDQWKMIANTLEQIGIKVYELDGVEGLPDMVFCANQSLPYEDERGDPHLIMSIMHSDERKEEVPYIARWFRRQGYNIHYLDEKQIEDFEGCGDAIWHTGRRLLWGGYGYRSSVKAYNMVSDIFHVPVVALELVDESFYHLDTCLCVLDEETALVYLQAFTREGRALIEKIFKTVIPVSAFEAKKNFACNATCPDGKNVIIQKGSTDVNKKLRDAGFSVHEVDTGEFIKSGGSVFCMKQLLW